MPRTTLDLDPITLRELRRRSLIEGKSIGQVASELLARVIARRDDLPVPEFAWVSADLGRPLVDLEDPEAMRLSIPREAGFHTGNPDGGTRD